MGEGQLSRAAANLRGLAFRGSPWEQGFPRAKHERFFNSNGRWSACDQQKASSTDE